LNRNKLRILLLFLFAAALSSGLCLRVFALESDELYTLELDSAESSGQLRSQATGSKLSLSFSEIAEVAVEGTIKRDFRLTCDKPVDFLGGNFSQLYLDGGSGDASFMRNALAARLSESLLIDVPHPYFCEVYLDEEYIGLYLLSTPVADSDGDASLRALQLLYSEDTNTVISYPKFLSVDRFIDLAILYEFMMIYPSEISLTNDEKIVPVPSADYAAAWSNYSGYDLDPAFLGTPYIPYLDVLMSDSSFINKVINRFRVLRRDAFSDESIASAISGLDTLIGPAVMRDAALYETGNGGARETLPPSFIRKYEEYYDAYINKAKSTGDVERLKETYYGYDISAYEPSYETELMKIRVLSSDHASALLRRLDELRYDENLVKYDVSSNTHRASVITVVFYLGFFVMAAIGGNLRVYRKTRNAGGN